MAELDIEIGGRRYRVACEDGQEQSLQAAAAVADGEARSLQGQMAHLSETRLMLMTTLMLADRVRETPQSKAVRTDAEAEETAAAQLRAAESALTELRERLGAAETARDAAEAAAKAAAAETTAADTAADRERIEALEAELAEAADSRARIATLEAELAAAAEDRARVATLEAELARAADTPDLFATAAPDGALAAATTQMAALEAERDAAMRAVAEAADRITAAETRAEEAEAAAKGAIEELRISMAGDDAHAAAAEALHALTDAAAKVRSLTDSVKLAS